MNYFKGSILLVLVFYFVLFMGTGICKNPDADRQVIFQTMPEQIILPDEDRAFSLDEVTFSDDCLRAALADNFCESVRMAFRDFDLSDTLGVRDDGVRYCQ